MKLFARATLPLLLALAGAHATAEAQDKPKPSHDRNQMTADEIRARPSTTVYELVRSRRSHWLFIRGQATLQTRTGTSFEGEATTFGVQPEIVVYVDNARQGSQETLRAMYTDDVDSLEFLDAITATQRFGTGHTYGAIVIRRRVR